MPSLKTWVVKHEGKWPVGACSVVSAETKEAATRLVLNEMARVGITTWPPKDKGGKPSIAQPEHWDWVEVDTSKAIAINILDGDY